MKQNTDENVFVICPFYKRESKHMIYCEGVDENSAIHVAFRTPAECRAYEKEFCRKYWGKCMIADALWRKYGEQIQCQEDSNG